MRGRLPAAIAAVCLLTAAGGCGGGESPIGVGVLSDCYGPFNTAHEAIVASAELPFLARGGELRGAQPSDGVEGTSVADHPVELHVGCVAGVDEVIPEARRLVEEDGVDVVVGPLNPEQGMALREYARTRPEVAFLIQPSGAPELTLADPAPNVFRFTPDAAQYVAGLGSYAYRVLGWRTAAIVGDDAPYSWEGAAGFVAEFCAAGGRIVGREWITPPADPAGAVDRLPRADGVYLGPAVSPMASFVERYAAGRGDVSKRLVGSGVLLYQPAAIAHAPGLVVAGTDVFVGTPAQQAYAAQFAKAFPHLPAGAGLGQFTFAFRDGVEAALDALERTDGAVGRPLLRALANVELASPAGKIRLDGNRQAVAPAYLGRVSAGKDGTPRVELIRVVPGVEQTFGGYFGPGSAPPSRTSPPCRKADSPPWAG